LNKTQGIMGMRAIKTAILWILTQFKIYPHIYFMLNPLKIFEFRDLIKNVDLSRNDKILDLGCGGGLQTLLLGQYCQEITGVEISESSIALARRKSNILRNRINCKFLCSKLEDATLENESFDKVFSICVLEHIGNYNEVLQEIYRILKKQGQIIFSVDCLEAIDDNELIEKHRRDHFVEKYFNKVELQELLEQTGFTSIDIYPIFKSPMAKRLFEEGVKNQFRYSLIGSIFNSARLSREEAKCQSESKGIFLVAKCQK